MNRSAFGLTKSLNKLTIAINERVNDYYRLYTSLKNYSYYFIVTHRQFITMFDMRQSDPVKMYVKTKPLGETIMDLVALEAGELENRPGDQTEFISDLMVVTESNKLNFIYIGEREVQISSKVV
jgi:hypothetical protein